MLLGDSGNTEKSNYHQYQSLGLEMSKNSSTLDLLENSWKKELKIILAFAIFPHIRLYVTVRKQSRIHFHLEKVILVREKSWKTL